MNVAEGQRILKEVQSEFKECVDAGAIAQKARMQKIISRAVENQIFESKSLDAAKQVLFEHLHDQVTLESLRRFCSIMIESEGYQLMQKFGKGLLAKLEEVMPRPGSSQVSSAAACDVEMEGGIEQQKDSDSAGGAASYALGEAWRKRPPEDHAEREWKQQKDSDTAGPMSDYNSSTLIAYREKLKTNVAMKPHLTDMLEEQAGGFMTRAEAQSVRKAEDPMGQLIEILLGKGDKEFNTFCDMLERSNHRGWANSLRLGAKPNRQKEVLSELYQEMLVTEDEVKSMKGEEGFLSDRVVLVQCSKHPEVVARTAIVLVKYGQNLEASQLGGIIAHHRVPDKHLGLSGDLGYSGLPTASTDLGYGGSSTVSSDLGYGGSSTVSSDLGYGGSSTVSSDLGYGGSSTAATSTHSSSHRVESYQKMSMHPLAEGSSLSQTELSSEEVEEESKHQGSEVPSGPAGEGSGPPREPDSAAVKGAEAALVDLCWIPFGIQSQSVGPEGGKLSLEPSAGAMGGAEKGTILLEVPPGAVSPAESVEVCSALIPDGPFTLPEGYQLGSMVVYLYYDGSRLTKPCTLSLPHWYGGEDQVQDGLSFAMAPHTLNEGESVYRFELLEGGRFAEQRQCGILELSGHCTLFAVVFKVKASSHYYASLWTHQVDGAVIANNAMESKVVITYADRVWVEVLEEYWKDWNMNKTIFGGFVKFGFSDNNEQVQGMLSSQFGGGWKASLEANTVCSKDVAYPCRRKRDKENLEWEVCRHIYPPAFSFVVQYNSLPDCSKVASIEQLIIEGTSRGSLRFPFTVYQVKTPHPPSSPSALASSSMGGCPSLPSPVDTGDEATAHPDAVTDGATTPPTETAAEVLDHFRDRFIKDAASSTIMYELKHRDVIASGDVAMIERKADVTQQNQYLHECLMRKCTKEALMEVCNVMSAVRGNPIMNALGKDMRRRLKAPPSLVHMVLEKYEEDFFKCVNAKLRLRRLIRRGVIADTIKGDIESANDDEAREILFDHLKQNANVDTLKEYLKVAIAADGYPNMQSLGRKMMEELQQGGEQTH